MGHFQPKYNYWIHEKGINTVVQKLFKQKYLKKGFQKLNVY